MSKPNILVFMTDQQRACSVLPGDPYKAITPVLDAFREDAVAFSRTYCPSPHCCPSRASFFSGLMPTQHGVWHNVNVTNAISRGMKSHIRPWSVDLEAAGYQMRFSGKWHCSNFQEPCDYGWDEGTPAREVWTLEQQDIDAREGEMRRIRDTARADTRTSREAGDILRPGYAPYTHYGSRENPFNDTTVVEHALQKLDQLQGDDPWCMYVGTLGPHDPYFPPQRFIDMYEGITFPLPDTFDDPMLDKPALYRRTRDRFSQLSREEHQESIKRYLAFCTYEDWLFGRMIDAIKARGDYENTVILFVSDHGDYLGDHGLWCKGLPAFLSNYHVPAVMKIPGGEKGIVRDAFVSLCDFGPTLLDIAGVESPVAFAGQSVMPLLNGSCDDDTPPWRDALFFQTNGNETYGIQRSVLTDKWRFVYNGFDYDELYDLEDDPGQMKNLATDAQYDAVKKDMYTRIWTFGFEHEEQMINEYIMTAMADYGPRMAVDGVP